MSDEKTKLSGPDLANGVALSTVAEGATLPSKQFPRDFTKKSH
jgi:hypothetical protein